MNYEILISISLGDNFPLQDEFLSKDCKTFAILEAKFNDEVLQSDPIQLSSPNPELATELGFRLHKKDFQQFRIERKSIKLQCFVEYSTLTDRYFIGYVVLHLRDAQEYTNEPKYKWNVLLNPKYKGSATKRPQLYLALMVNKLTDLESSIDGEQIEGNHALHENQFTRPIKKENMHPSLTESCSSSMFSSNYFDTNLKVKLQNGFFYIWDENLCIQNDCNQLYTISVQIDKPRNLINLFANDSEIDLKGKCYFKYSLLGQQIKTNTFQDLFNFKDFKKDKSVFQILTNDIKTLQDYFESYPTIEIQFCLNQKLFGFVTINLLRLFQKNNSYIDRDYMIVPEDESVYVREPSPVINVNIKIVQNEYSKKRFEDDSNTSKFSTAERPDKVIDKPSTQLSNINHYYIAIDLRTIKLNLTNFENCSILFQPFYLQFSYAFFGITDYIKTYPSISFLPEHPENFITIPHGFCGFNFATSEEKLNYTFSNVPLIVQLILEKGDTLLGTAEIDLSCLLKKYSESDKSCNDVNDNFVNTTLSVHDELNDQICEIQAVMFLQEIHNSNSNQEINAKLKELYTTVPNEEKKTSDLFDNLNDMIIETAHDIELWKEEQMKLFKKKLKQKENEFLNNLSINNDSQTQAKFEELKDFERKLNLSLEKINDREQCLKEKERFVELRQKELEEKFSKLTHEIDAAIHDVRMEYEEKTCLSKNKIISLEQEKHKCQEKIYQLERKVKEKDLKIKDLENKIFELSQTNRKGQNQRATSLTRSMTNCSRNIIVTRDSQNSKNIIENKPVVAIPSVRSSKLSSTALKTKNMPSTQRIHLPPSSKNSVVNAKGGDITEKIKKDRILTKKEFPSMIR